MRKLIFAIALIMVSLQLTAQVENFMVQIAVFDKQVSADYFMDVTHPIYYSRDANDFHRYYVGKFSEAKATEISQQLKATGYNTAVMDEGSFNAKCTCYKTPLPRELMGSLQSIFFDFDKYNLRAESRRQLNSLASNLKENPTFTVRLMAHTDAKGSNDYNDRLSQNRANATRNYLIAKGIAASRVKIETFGEVKPIAKNELAGGQDTAQGRQLNRRVEFQVLNAAGQPVNIVEDIYVPSSLSVN